MRTEKNMQAVGSWCARRTLHLTLVLFMGIDTTIPKLLAEVPGR